MQPMQDQLANGNYGQYLAQALTPPTLGMPGTTGGYGNVQGLGPQISNAGLGQFGQGQPGQGQFGPGQFGQGQFGQGQFGQGNSAMLGGIAQPGYGAQGLQQHHIAATLHQLAHQAAAQTMLSQQTAAMLGQLAHQCAWQAQAFAQNWFGGLGPQFGYGLAGAMPFAQGGFGGFNRPLW